MLHRNSPQDLKIYYKASIYEKIEEIFGLGDGEQPLLHLMLALMGYKNGNKVSLETRDGSSDSKFHEFSIRTVYQRNESDLDASYGLLAILDNQELTYDEVINGIAFERTSMNKTPFLKMTNVKTFYEYMLAGIDFFEQTFFIDGKKPEEIAFNIHEFLLDDQSEINDILIELLTEEKGED